MKNQASPKKVSKPVAMRPPGEVLKEIQDILSQDDTWGVIGFAIKVKSAKSTLHMSWGDFKTPRTKM